MTTDEFKATRIALGLSLSGLSKALGLGDNGADAIRRIEAGGKITGPMALAMAKLRDDTAG